MISKFYVFPCGMFDGPDVKDYSVIRHRLTPTTPQGDCVGSGLTKTEARRWVEQLSRQNATLEEARSQMEHTT